MSGRHESGDATGWKHGAKGIDGVGKPIASMNKQRFERDIPSIKKQAATTDKVIRNRTSHKEGKIRNWGIDGGR